MNVLRWEPLRRGTSHATEPKRAASSNFGIRRLGSHERRPVVVVVVPGRKVVAGGARRRTGARGHRRPEAGGEDVEVLQVHARVVVEVALREHAVLPAEVGREDVEVLEVDPTVARRVALEKVE